MHVSSFLNGGIRMRKVTLALGLGVMALFSACNGTHQNRFKEQETQQTEATINYNRFDQTIFELDQCIHRPAIAGDYDQLKVNIPDEDSLCMQQKINQIKAEYPTQFKHYMMMLGELSSGYDIPAETLFYLFLSNDAYHELFQDCLNKYQDDADLRAYFSKAFSRAQQLIPGYEIPQNIFFIFSGFGDYLCIDENTLYVSLEYFLGDDYKNYQYVPGIYQYQIKNMKRECIVPNAIYECTCEHFPLMIEAGNLLDHLLYLGKMLYITEAILPQEDAKNIIGYTKDEWEWCEKNEASMWNYLREKNLLFETDNKTITDFIIISGATKYFSTEKYNAPGRAAVWLGWQIITQYMEKNPNLSLTDLIHENDAQKILMGSRYNP